MNANVEQEHPAEAARGVPGRRYQPLRIFRGSLEDLLHPPSNQIAFLHGLRAIAILLVMNHHFSAAFTEKFGDNVYANSPVVLAGWSGVDLFFVLSGFFIGSQLWKEVAKTGTLSIGRFILRRGLRIWPLFYATYLFALLYAPATAALRQYGWGDLVFLANYFNTGIVGGGWSLCTEEQFYILAPLLIYWAKARAHMRDMRWALWGILLLLPLERAAFWIHRTGGFYVHDPNAFASIYYKFNTHCDGLVIGVLISHLWVFGDRSRMTRRRSAALVFAGFVALVLLREWQHEIFIFSGLALFFGSLVWLGLTPGIIWFRSRIFYWISRLSFGMYLNHGYLIHLVLSRGLPRTAAHSAMVIPTQLFGTLLLIVLSAFVSLITFTLIEQPFLYLRSRLLSER